MRFQGSITPSMILGHHLEAADEAFVTSASTFVMPVVEIDGAAIGEGAVGPVAKRLREIYLDESLKAAV